MEVEITRNSQWVVRPVGIVDLVTVDKLISALDEAVEQSPKGFVIDLTRVPYIDSAGIAAILNAYQRLHPVGGKLALVLVEGDVKRIISLIHLEMIPGFFLCENVAAAKQALASEAAPA